MPATTTDWNDLSEKLTGDLHCDEAHRILYATDASVYRELPQAVAFPRSEEDIVACVAFAAEKGIALTPRAGGTSLAGQATGGGLVVDVSRYLTKIVEINTTEGYAIVEPGVIRDQLNDALRPLGYWFGPNTSTANRCTMAGMFGNNSCGSTSITVGSTREHVLAARVVLSDATVHSFGAGTQVPGEVSKEQGPNSPCLRRANQFLAQTLHEAPTRNKVRAAFPKAGVSRRNTGYALDILLSQAPFTKGGPAYNLCALLAGSEGTLGFTTQMKVRILPLPPAGTAILALHFNTVRAAMRATQEVMRHQPFMCELMDDTILNLARENPQQRRNAAFVVGNPRALLLVEFRAETNDLATEKARSVAESPVMTNDLAAYAAPVMTGAQQAAVVWNLRAAGLGILGNMVGDAKAVACIEDTAVALPDLADYIHDVGELMDFYSQNVVYYAHAGAGELHLRPVLNLKTTAGQQDFYKITRDVARLVKQYGGSLSGEHGDGRVRAPFLPELLGDEVYALLVELKQAFDPQGIFNPGKIVEAPPMLNDLRYVADAPTPEYQTILNFDQDGGLLRAAEKCNGSGDCRKMSGGAMCPSYRALRSEQHCTRGRANTMREVLTQNQHNDPFAHPALAEAIDLCLSCKACTSECPSSVDMTNLKAEYLHQRGSFSLRSRMIGANEHLYALGGKIPRLSNWLLEALGPVVKKVMGVAPGRSLPAFPQQSLRSWYKQQASPPAADNARTIYLFGDEFVNLQDPQVGRATILLLQRLGYSVVWPDHATSGRAQLSKGLLRGAQKRALSNVNTFAPLVTDEHPLVGIEPSAVLGFRDEYPKLLRQQDARKAEALAAHVYTLDEFLFREFTAGRIGPDNFGDLPLDLVLHVHCHEKALGDKGKCAAALSLPPNFNVRLLDSGCCGMAGSFGYEAEHFELSKTIAEQSLLNDLKDVPPTTCVVASGTSCRHQLKDLGNRQAISTAEALLRSWGEGDSYE
ncbi:FAD-binding protein [Neolewinella aurantiaca]|uniref:FAD-binding protein n=1 Tax=Neolewinella aurantiaca TaxID=2602767 RepID=A0A5C7FDP3_9BACT|nr:FAD-binding and (Fe-S)-binding domain-containing protein [Neolewinella aurantiaca]TXF85427.1 FAD-binding protein [Neolewinella aurantiaca]